MLPSEGSIVAFLNFGWGEGEEDEREDEGQEASAMPVWPTTRKPTRW